MPGVQARQRRLRRNRTRAIVAGGIVVALAAAAMVAGAGGDDDETADSTTTSTAAETTTTATTVAPTTAPTASGDPEAPWRTGTVPRAEVDQRVISAWEKADNRSTCRLLVPSEFGPGMDKPNAGSTPITDNAGWEISFRQGASVVQIQGLFAKASRTERTEGEIFSRRWSDGSLARYGPDARNEEDPNPDPETTANEAVLLLPDQDCAYVIYDTRGRSEIEFILEHLHFVEGTE